MNIQSEARSRLAACVARTFEQAKASVARAAKYAADADVRSEFLRVNAPPAAVCTVLDRGVTALRDKAHVSVQTAEIRQAGATEMNAIVNRGTSLMRSVG
mgnify:CR=1 FL=1